MMMIFVRYMLGIALIGTVFLTGPETAYANNCLSPSAARQAVNAGKAAPLSQIARRIRGQIVGADLCRRGGRLVYVVTVLQANGAARRVVVNARTGR